MTDGDKFGALRERLAEKHHGTRHRYLAGCRCMLCRAANSRYETERARLRRGGDWNGIVNAAEARRHIRKLQRRGLGRRSIADASDVPRRVVRGIASGQRWRCRAQTARRILAVTEEARGDRSLVPAGRTWRILARLIAAGYTRAQLARWMGYRNGALQFNRHQVTARTESRVERLARLVEAGKLRRDR